MPSILYMSSLNLTSTLLFFCFFLFFEENGRVALLLCQAKGEHNRLVPQELCLKPTLGLSATRATDLI